MNVGRRAAVDFSAICILRIPRGGSNDNFKVIPLPTLDTPLPYLAPGRSRSLSIKTFGIDEQQLRLVPDDLRGLLEPGSTGLLGESPGCGGRI